MTRIETRHPSAPGHRASWPLYVAVLLLGLTSAVSVQASDGKHAQEIDRLSRDVGTWSGDVGRCDSPAKEFGHLVRAAEQKKKGELDDRTRADLTNAGQEAAACFRDAFETGRDLAERHNEVSDAVNAGQASEGDKKRLTEVKVPFCKGATMLRESYRMYEDPYRSPMGLDAIDAEIARETYAMADEFARLYGDCEGF